MEATERFRAGQRVRIRAGADSDFAGFYGVILHVGQSVCDVKIRYRLKGSKVRQTHIGTFHKDDLESLRKPADLALFGPRRPKTAWRTWAWLGGVAVVVVLILLSVRY